MAYCTTSFANYQPGSDVLIHVALSSVLGFLWDKIGIVDLCSLWVPKIINFIDAFNCYKQKCKLVRLIWPTLSSFLWNSYSAQLAGAWEDVN